MTDYLTEQEQIQQLKNWLKEYGMTIIIGIVLALIITTAWRYWQQHETKMLTHASVIYDEMLMLRAQNNINGSHIQAQKLISHYPKTPYATMAALLLARNAIIENKYETAIQELQWVIDHSKDESIREISRIRLARVLIAQKKPDEALTLLNKVNDKTFLGLVNEVRGDAFLAKNNTAEARKSYALALSELPNAELSRPILQMKYDNLATESMP